MVSKTQSVKTFRFWSEFQFEMNYWTKNSTQHKSSSWKLTNKVAHHKVQNMDMLYSNRHNQGETHLSVQARCTRIRIRDGQSLDWFLSFLRRKHLINLRLLLASDSDSAGQFPPPANLDLCFRFWFSWAIPSSAFCTSCGLATAWLLQIFIFRPSKYRLTARFSFFNFPMQCQNFIFDYDADAN
jgi:hypothetical protein